MRTYLAQKGFKRRYNDIYVEDRDIYPHDKVSHPEIENVENTIQQRFPPINSNKISILPDVDDEVHSYLLDTSKNIFKNKLGATPHLSHFLKQAKIPYYYLTAKEVDDNPLAFWIHRGKNVIEDRKNVHEKLLEYGDEGTIGKKGILSEIKYYANGLGLPQSYIKSEIQDAENANDPIVALQSLKDTLKDLFNKEVEYIDKHHTPIQKALLAKTKSQLLNEATTYNTRWYKIRDKSKRNIYRYFKEMDELANTFAQEQNQTIDEFIEDYFGKKIANQIYDYNTYKSILNNRKKEAENFIRKMIGEKNMKYKNLWKMQGGGVDTSANPACMAISQALPQLPEDLKVAAEQAIKSGQCEQFIQMLKQQAQTGSVDSNAPMAQEGMPMAKFGARFGKPLSQIEYGKKIGQIGLYEILKAQRGLFGRKQKAPVRQPVDVTKMSYEELYNHFRSIGYPEENAKIAAKNLDEGNQLYHRPKTTNIEHIPEKEVLQEKPFLLKELTDYVENEILPNINKSDDTDNIKGKFVDSKGEVWDIEEEDPDNIGGYRRRMVRKYLAPDMLNEEFPDPTEWDKDNRKNREIYNKNMKKEYYEKEGLMDNADPIRGEISEYIIKYRLPITETELDNMTDAEKMVLLDRLRKKYKSASNVSNANVKRSGYLVKMDEDEKNYDYNNIPNTLAYRDERIERSGYMVPKKEKAYNTDNIIQNEIISELIRQGFKGDKDTMRVMSDLVWEKMKSKNYTLLQAIKEFTSK